MKIYVIFKANKLKEKDRKSMEIRSMAWDNVETFYFA